MSGTGSGNCEHGTSQSVKPVCLEFCKSVVPRGGFKKQSCLRDYDVTNDAAGRGDASAQLNLGFMYYLGQGVSKDYSQAGVWFRIAADRGNAKAQLNLGLLYYQGLGVSKDLRLATAWFRKAAEQGDAYAQNTLGVQYAKGEGVPQDDVQAVAWYRKAAEQGNASAQLNLGVAYENGGGVPKDDGEAYFWVKLATTVPGKTLGAKPEDFGPYLDVIASHLTAAALSAARERVQGWIAAHPASRH
jgi:uncharacterized protein